MSYPSAILKSIVSNCQLLHEINVCYTEDTHRTQTTAFLAESWQLCFFSFFFFHVDMFRSKCDSDLQHPDQPKIHVTGSNHGNFELILTLVHLEVVNVVVSHPKI